MLMVVVTVVVVLATVLGIWWWSGHAGNGDERSSERRHRSAHQEPDREARVAALAQILGRADLALLWSAVNSSPQQEMPDPPVVESAGVAQARERLQAGALSGQALPRRPQLLPQLMMALNDPASTATKLAGIIGQDPVLAATLMRIANSAAHRRRHAPLESLERVVVKVGQEGLERLLSAALVQPVLALEERELRGFAAVLWRHARLASAAAADHARVVERIDPLPLQLGSLLPALAALLVLRALPALADVPLAPDERLQLLQASHYTVAAEIARRWELPDSLASALEGEPGEATNSLMFGRRIAWAWMQVEDGQMEASEARQALAAHAPAQTVEWAWQRLKALQQAS